MFMIECGDAADGESSFYAGLIQSGDGRDDGIQWMGRDILFYSFFFCKCVMILFEIFCRRIILKQYVISVMESMFYYYICYL